MSGDCSEGGLNQGRTLISKFPRSFKAPCRGAYCARQCSNLSCSSLVLVDVVALSNGILLSNVVDGNVIKPAV